MAGFHLFDVPKILSLPMLVVLSRLDWSSRQLDTDESQADIKEELSGIPRQMREVWILSYWLSVITHRYARVCTYSP